MCVRERARARERERERSSAICLAKSSLLAPDTHATTPVSSAKLQCTKLHYTAKLNCSKRNYMTFES